MSDDKKQPADSKSWFVRNQSGFGFHPRKWQGWVLLLAVVALIVVIVVLLRTGIV
ncbi:MAG: hypothetical protein V4479_00925 [Actinomycetota bacterium]